MARKTGKRTASDADQTVCGFHAVASLVRRQSDLVREVRVDRDRSDRRMHDLIDLVEAEDIPVLRVAAKELDHLAAGTRHQGVVARTVPRPQRSTEDLTELLHGLDEAAFLLVLDQVQDPHNLGACLRTAECAGVHAVIVPRDGAAPVNDTVRRVAAGAADRVPVHYVTNLSRTLSQLKEQGIWVIGSSDQADQDLYACDLRGPVALVLGAEGRGIRRLTAENCDLMLSIPMAGSVSSLNVSVAAGVLLFEAKRQRIPG